MRSSTALSLVDQAGSEETLEQLINEAVGIVNNFQSGGQKSEPCKSLGYALQILQNILFKLEENIIKIIHDFKSYFITCNFKLLGN